ncbi:hypothetical protein ACTXT7_012144 [Hymenolepis weldensis]
MLSTVPEIPLTGGQKLIEILVSQGVNASKVDKLMEQFDLNGNGIIHLGEYKIALGISTQPMEAWKSFFDELDRRNSRTREFPKRYEHGMVGPSLGSLER